MFILYEFFTAGSIFTLLAMIWSVFTPCWIENLIESSSRYLIKITGILMLFDGLIAIVAIAKYGNVIFYILAPLGIVMGIRLLQVASRDAILTTKKPD